MGVVLPMVAYAALALAAYYPTWPGDPTRIPQCTCADAGLNTWFLAVTAHAITHGLDPFFTQTLNYPRGVNLTYNTQMPLLGLVATPVTLTVGPIASLNLLMWLAFPLSASSLFFVLRRWTTWVPAAWLGGLVYGFSPYMVGQSTAHLHLIFVPFPPLILLASFELFVRRAGSPRRWGLILGILVVGQFFISSEVLVTTGLMMAIGLAVLALARPDQIVPAIRFAASGIAGCLAVVVALLAYPTWVFLAGPAHYTGATHAGATFLLRSDLLGPVVPTSLERLAPFGASGFGDRLTILGDYSEDGTYLGIPLCIALVALVVRSWANRWIRFAAAMAGMAFILSLGGSLTVGGHATGLPLPAALLTHVPLVNQLVPSRLALWTMLFVAVLVALGLDAWHAAHRTRPPQGPDEGRDPALRTRRRQALVLALLAVVVTATWVPRWPNQTVAADLPPYFTSGAVNRIRPGTVALTYPYATPLHAQPMVWQAVTGMRFSLLGGYALIPDARGVPALFPSILAPRYVQRFLIDEAGGVPFYVSGPVSASGTLIPAIRTFLVRYHVGVVLVERRAPHAGAVTRQIQTALGRDPTVTGGIDAWYHVQSTPNLKSATQ